MNIESLTILGFSEEQAQAIIKSKLKLDADWLAMLVNLVKRRSIEESIAIIKRMQGATDRNDEPEVNTAKTHQEILEGFMLDNPRFSLEDFAEYCNGILDYQQCRSALRVASKKYAIRSLGDKNYAVTTAEERKQRRLKLAQIGIGEALKILKKHPGISISGLSKKLKRSRSFTTEIVSAILSENHAVKRWHFGRTYGLYLLKDAPPTCHELILFQVMQNPGQKVSGLAKTMGINRSTIDSKLSPLIENKLVYFEYSTWKGHKVRHVYPTQKAFEVYGEKVA